MTYRVTFYLRTLIILALVIVPNVTLAQLTLLNDMVLDGNALLMPSNATYGRAINGVSFKPNPCSPVVTSTPPGITTAVTRTCTLDVALVGQHVGSTGYGL